jgi:hypothetical protein
MRRSIRTTVVIVALLVLAGMATACSGDAASESTTTTTEPAVETTTTTEVPLSAGREVSFYVPAVGDCYDVRQVDQPVPIYLVLDCALPHQNEVFATFDYTGSKDYPGPGPMEDQAKRQCPPSWEAYVGAPYETSHYELAYQLPDQAGWGNGVRHVVGCLVVDPSGEPITGSTRGTAG